MMNEAAGCEAAKVTTAALASALGVAPWRIRRLWERGEIEPPAQKIANVCVFSRAEIAAVVAGLASRGWLPTLAPPEAIGALTAAELVASEQTGNGE